MRELGCESIRLNPLTNKPAKLEADPPSATLSSADKGLPAGTSAARMPAELEADSSMIPDKLAAPSPSPETTRATEYASEPIKVTIDANLVALVLLSALSLVLFCFGRIDQTTFATMVLTSWLSGLVGSIVARKMAENRKKILQELNAKGGTCNKGYQSNRSDRTQYRASVDCFSHLFELVTSIFVLMAVITIGGIVYAK